MTYFTVETASGTYHRQSKTRDYNACVLAEYGDEAARKDAEIVTEAQNQIVECKAALREMGYDPNSESDSERVHTEDREISKRRADWRHVRAEELRKDDPTGRKWHALWDQIYAEAYEVIPKIPAEDANKLYLDIESANRRLDAAAAHTVGDVEVVSWHNTKALAAKPSVYSKMYERKGWVIRVSTDIQKHDKKPKGTKSSITGK